jgi:prevent-host-death family protein
MATIVDMSEAKAHLSSLYDRAVEGEEIIISVAGIPKAKLVRVDDAPASTMKISGAPEDKSGA